MKKGIFIIASLMIFSSVTGCKVFKKKCDCPKFTEQKDEKQHELVAESEGEEMIFSN